MAESTKTLPSVTTIVCFTAKAFTEMADGFKSAIYWLGDVPRWLFIWWALVAVAAVLAAHA